MAAKRTPERVALVFPERKGKRKHVDIDGPLRSFAGQNEGIIFTVFNDTRGIERGLGAAALVDDFEVEYKQVIYGKVVDEGPRKGLTITPIAYKKGGFRHNETGYRPDVNVHVSAATLRAGNVLVSRGVDLTSLETSEEETFPEDPTGYHHPYQSETLNHMPLRGK